MLTTVDNPYNPYKDYEKWQMWDRRMGYNTAGFLARLVGPYNPELPLPQVEDMIENAYSRILESDVTGHYAVIFENDTTPLDQNAYLEAIKNS